MSMKKYRLYEISRSMSQVKQGKKGIALVIAAAVLIALAALAVVMLSRSVSESGFGRRHSMMTQAFWLGEAGVDAARSQLSSDWYDRVAQVGSLSTGSYSFNIYDVDKGGNPLINNQLRVVSTGTTGGGVSRSIEAIVEDVPYDNFQYAVLGAGLVELRPGSTVHGDIYVDGDVEVQAGANVVKVDDSDPLNPIPNAYDADVSYTGLNKGIAPGSVEGSVTQTTDIIAPPTFDWGEIQADADFDLPSGTALNGAIADGVYYIAGDVTLNNVKLGQGAIIAEGMVESSGNFTLDSPEAGYPALASQTNIIEITGSADIKGLVYCSGSGIELKTGATMTVEGSVISTDASVEIKTDLGDLQVYHKEEYLLRLPDSILVVASWEDLEHPYQLIP